MVWYNPLTWRGRDGEYLFREPSRAGQRRANPHSHPGVQMATRQAGFFSQDAGRLLSGWEVSTNRVDFYLQSELTPLRARSRAEVRKGPFGARFVGLMQTNVVGSQGVRINPQVQRGAPAAPVPDTLANEAMKAAFKDWGENHADWQGRASWLDFQNMAILTATQDGEYLFREHKGPDAGPYGYQLEAIDPELLDVTKTTSLASGGEIRLGVEYDSNGRIVRYHFRDTSPHMVSGGYITGREYTVEAEFIIHGFMPKWADQSRGVPWMHASLEAVKHHNKYVEAAIVRARAAAAVFSVLKSKGDEKFKGGEVAPGREDGTTLQSYEAGTIHDIGDRELQHVDTAYPHTMYASFVKTNLQAIASGLNVSYHTLANDLEGVNYSSARAGTLEDREVYKGLQSWFVRSLVRRVYESWVEMAILSGAIRIGGRTPLRSAEAYRPAHYQPRRWSWVDPQKDGQANDMAIRNRTRSASSVIRDQGDEPDEVFREIADERAAMAALNIEPVEATTGNGDNAPNEGDDDGD